LGCKSKNFIQQEQHSLKDFQKKDRNVDKEATKTICSLHFAL